ncbi:MAG: cytochrome b/b6 domain-containing protein [Roseivivax sp.]|nr:cytochrome b/b6 domain-containing protein [Roseivivax sp.]
MQSYSKLQVILHWLTVLIIAAQFVFHDAISAAFRATMRGQEAEITAMVPAHVWGGVIVLLLTLWRLSLRLTHGAPPSPEPSSPAREMVAKLTHVGIYGLLVLLPISGSVAWFLGVGNAGEAHEILKTILLVLVVLHVLAALYHQFVLKNGLMTRMSLRG